MTGYAELTRRLITRVKELDPSTYVIWGGIHPIIQPEDAILADVDAICTGEGEFAFEELRQKLIEGRDPTDVKNFWFKQPDGEIIKNHFLPLMSVDMMESLPFPQYGDGEVIYEAGVGFQPMNAQHYIENDGLSYTTLWSIGCPFHCTYCGNTKFISNDAKYKRIRHPSARYIVDEVKTARERFPHLSHVSFHDDSFMAIPYREIEEFAELWKAELDLPFAVYGVIPNYVKRDKFELLTWAGMNRVRMGIQSGSRKTLEFYKRPSPPEKILAAGEVNASFAPKYHIPPAYDIITDNPVETRDDIRETLQLLYDMQRPYTLFIYSLKVIPNTELEKAMKETRDRHRGDLGDVHVDPAAAEQPAALHADAVAPAGMAVEAAAQARQGQHRGAADVSAAGPPAAHAVPLAARAEPPREDGLLGDPGQDRLLRVAHRPRQRVAQAPDAAHAAPGAARARDRARAAHRPEEDRRLRQSGGAGRRRLRRRLHRCG